METIGAWLLTELEKRGWTQAELARRANLADATLSRIISETRQAGPDTAVAIARALHVPPETVFRRAGLLPPLPPEVEEEREVIAIWRRLPASVRRTVATMLRGLAGQAPGPGALTDPGEDHIADDILIPELLEEFRQIPDEWKETAINQVAELRRAAERPSARIIGEELETERNAETPQT